MAFDIAGARKAGYSDDEIVKFLHDSDDKSFDVKGALNSGYSPSEVLDHLSGAAPAAAPQSQAAPSEPEVSTGEDVAKSAGIGVANGAIGVAGLPAVVGSKLGQLRDRYITNPILTKLGFKPYDEAYLNSADPAEKLTPSALQQDVEGVTGKFYEPKTRSGKFAEAATRGATGAVLTGGGLGGALTMGALPSVVGEGARQGVEALGGGETAQNVADLAGNLLTGARGFREAPRNVPTRQAIDTASTHDLDAFRRSGLEVEPLHVQAHLSDTQQHLYNDRGFGPNAGSAPETHALLDQITQQPVGLGNVTSASDLANLRKSLRNVVKTGGEDGAAAQIALNRFDGFIDNLPNSPAVRAGNAAEAVRSYRAGNQNYTAARRMEDLDRNVIEHAENRGGATYSGDNTANAIRQRAASVLNNDGARVGLTPQELDQYRRLAHGTMVGNTARRLDKGVAKFMLGAGLGLGIYEGSDSPTAALAIPFGLRHAGRMIHERSVYNQARRLNDMIASRSALGQSMPQPPLGARYPQAIVPAALAAARAAQGQ